MKIALKITPQRSTQYANMTAQLAIPELLASPVGRDIVKAEPVNLAGQGYLLVSFVDTLEALTPLQIEYLSRLGATSEIYEYFDQIGEIAGPLLRPLDPPFRPFVPLEMAEARRYKGKTNEIFTRVLLNVALYAGDYRDRVTERLRILDPLAGGGTTLFLALAAGYDAFGIEQERQDVETTAVFAKQYFQGERISYHEEEQKHRTGKRILFEVGKPEKRWLVFAQGDNRQADQVLANVPGGPRMHAIVGDLPYGIQHFGEIESMLQKALPVWENLLLPGGTLALAWNATRIERAEMHEMVERSTSLSVCNEAPYTDFTHAVDRVIKKRDILIAVKKA
jgi:hypothetical protein